MKEIISFSLGKHSNHISTHFWNSQDENLKVLPFDDSQQEIVQENTQIAYHELEKSQQMVPRHIYVDFRDNFGNFSSCFGNNNVKVADVKSELWYDQVEKQQTNQIEQSKFQKELQWIDQMYYDSQIYENEDQEEEKQEDPDKNQDYDSEEEEKPQISKNNTKDFFAQFYQQQIKEQPAAEAKKVKKDKYFEEKKKLEAIQQKTPKQLYEHYNFESDINYFTDFMQSQMSQKFNQLIVPHSHIAEENFKFFSKGRELWNLESNFRDDLEDKIRNQLEIADLLQGFQITVDSNSGFGSMTNQMITYFLKDEAPKAPIFLYSVNNSQKIQVHEEADEQERTNQETRQKLIGINQSLFFSEIIENADLIIPFDEISIGSEISKYFGGFNSEKLFHQSAIQTLVQQNVYNIIQKKRENIDMVDFQKQVLYQGSKINIVLPQIQIPIQIEQGLRYLEKIQKNHIQNRKYFVGFNKLSALHVNRRPIRHTFILRGSQSLIQKDENPRVFREQFEQFVFQNTEFERGLKTFQVKESHFLPIPYPRYFTENLISTDGYIRPKGSQGSEFLQEMPSLTKLMFDGQYLGHIESLYSNLKHISAVTRYNLLRENDNMEEDEWRDKVDQLKDLAEQFKQLAMNEEPSDQGSDSYDY